MSKCRYCGMELNLSLYNPEKTMKSCPACSRRNGKYHVFHNYPDAFGMSEKRSSKLSPEGAQSHCTACRGMKITRDGTLCKDLPGEGLDPVKLARIK